jgi:hypothetical protein
MADPLSIATAVITIITAAIQSSVALCETVKRFKDRDTTLARLQEELEDLVKILSSLNTFSNTPNSMLKLLERPIERCTVICQEFEKSMKSFSGNSKTKFIDWARMEFRKGSINEFIDALTGYKSTIFIGLGVVIMSGCPKDPQNISLLDLLLIFIQAYRKIR